MLQMEHDSLGKEFPPDRCLPLPDLLATRRRAGTRSGAQLQEMRPQGTASCSAATTRYHPWFQESFLISGVGGCSSLPFPPPLFLTVDECPAVSGGQGRGSPANLPPLQTVVTGCRSLCKKPRLSRSSTLFQVGTQK